ncbi:MAG TPA: PHP domain-containing protein, partial [Streptosporangiaceae bacterium]|nr:PHP domain-containing protein [Streptosporangiaceae bacterium]
MDPGSAVGWDNPPVPWAELRRRMSWRAGGQPPEAEPADPETPPEAQPAEPETAPPVPSELVSLPEVGRVPWAELHCHSAFSFLDGAAAPGELVAEAARLGLETLAITDHDGMYGVPQFAQAAARLAEHGARLRTVFGAELSLGLPPGGYGGAGSLPVRGGSRGVVPPDQSRHLLVLARDPEGYRRLCAVISAAQLAGGGKGRPAYDTGALAGAHDGHWVVLTGCRKGQVPAALAAGG